MLRNREIQLLLLTMIFISMIMITIGFFISHIAGWVNVIFSLLMIASIYLFTKWRYYEIEKLSNYLRDISNGNYSLDVRDNAEGELSILKSEIFKVTNMLSEHGAHLQQDKAHLMNAISDISHQLKTPLTSMMVMADILEDPQLPVSKRMEFTNIIHVQLERLDWLVSSLLKLSKIDAGTVYFKKDSIFVKDLLEASLESVLIPMDIKQQKVNVEGKESISIIGDLHWTKEALINILKNCVEHTPEGGEIEIFYSENVLFTEIIMKDNGKGIPKEDLPYIFQRFYKGKYASEESVGIGLAMAHRIITSQGGDIEVSSEVGKGTQFHIKFYHQDITKN